MYGERGRGRELGPGPRAIAAREALEAKKVETQSVLIACGRDEMCCEFDCYSHGSVLGTFCII